MLRRLLMVLSALSLVLCVAVAVLWARSYTIQYSVTWTYPQRTFSLVASKGRIVCASCTAPRALGGGFNPPHGRVLDVHSPPTDMEAAYRVRATHQGRLGFWAQDSGPSRFRYRSVLFPCWAVALATLIPAVLWVRGYCASGRLASSGLCTHCGYDLRATPGRCPECGTATSL